MKKKFLNLLILFIITCLSAVGFTACTEHQHEFNKQVVSSDYLVSEATCTKKATYHYSCECSEAGTETFEAGDLLEHNFVDGVCTVCQCDEPLFLSGTGTSEDPYVIETAKHLANISKVNEFSYYKVKDGVEELDLSDWISIRLNGSLDGNNVKFVNLSTRLFTHVGNNEEKEIYVKNFEVDINLVSSTHAALIKEIDNFGTTVFENIQIHGYIEGESNTAALYSFGVKNGHETGSDYTVELKNVDVDADIVCVTANPVAVYIAHAFPGTGYKLTLNVDSASEFTGNLYSAGDMKYNEYIAIGDYEIYKDGASITQAEFSTKQIKKVAPVLGDDGYTLTAESDVSKITVSITAQVTAYDENGEKIPTKNGITLTLDTFDITNNLTGNVKVFDSFEYAEIVNHADEFKAEIVNDVLKIYIAQDTDYRSGFIRLQVQQYNANNEIISSGTLDVYTLTFIVAENAVQAQEALDNAASGTTIFLKSGVNYGTLYLRPGKAPTKEVDWLGNNYGYETYSLFENITILGKGAIIDAIEIEGGFYYHTEHSQSANYPVMLSLIELKNFVIDGVTFTGKGGYDPQGYGNAINLSGNNIKVDGLTLKNCVLENSDNNARLLYKTESTTFVHNYSYSGKTFTFSPTLKDITITNCVLNGGYMGIELRETENITITNNVFNVADRNILLPANTDCTYTGTITITGNVSNDAQERFVRADGTGDAVVVITNNTLNNYCGQDEDFIKVTNGNNVTVENNTLN